MCTIYLVWFGRMVSQPVWNETDFARDSQILSDDKEYEEKRETFRNLLLL